MAGEFGKFYIRLSTLFDPKGLKTAQTSLDKTAAKTKALGESFTKLSLLIGGVAIAASKMTLDFDDSMVKIVSLVGLGRDEVNAWKEDIMKLSTAVGKSPKELADAMFFITSAGLRGSVALKALEFSAKAAAAGLGEVSSIADAVTSAINAYGASVMSAEQATDVLLATVREGKMDAAALTPVVGRILLPAQKLGVSFNEVGAALAAMSRKGFNAAESATALRGVFMAMTKQSEDGEKALNNVGLSYAKLSDILRKEGLLKFLEVINEKFGDNTVELSRVFTRVEGLVGLMGLVGNSMDTTAKIFGRMNDTVGSTNTAFDEAAKEGMFKVKQAIATLNVAMLKLGSVVLPIVIPQIIKFTEKLQDLIQQFSDLEPKTQKTIVKIAGLVAVIGPLLLVLSKLISLLSGASSALVFLGPLLLSTARNMVLLFNTIKVVGIWQTLATLIGTITGALGLLGVAAWMWYDDWEEITSGIKTISKEFEETFKATIIRIAEQFKISGNTVKTVWSGVKSALKEQIRFLLTAGGLLDRLFQKPSTEFVGPPPTEFVGPPLSGKGSVKKPARQPAPESELRTPAVTDTKVAKAAVEDRLVKVDKWYASARGIEEVKYNNWLYNQTIAWDELDVAQKEATMARVQEIYTRTNSTMAGGFTLSIQRMQEAGMGWAAAWEGMWGSTLTGMTANVAEFLTFSENIFDNFRKLLDGIFKSILSSFVQMVAQMIAEWLLLQAITGFFGGDVAKKLLGSRKEGGPIPETGPYLLHKGEEVLPADIAGAIRKSSGPSMTPAFAGASMGGNITIEQHIDIGGTSETDINVIADKLSEASKNGAISAVNLAKVNYKIGKKRDGETSL